MEKKIKASGAKNSLTLTDTCRPLLVKSKFLIKKSEQTKKCSQKYKKSWILANSFISVLSIITIILFWMTDIYNRLIIENVLLKNNTDMLAWWMKPPIDPILKVYVFNYTNIERFLDGTDNKIKLQEIGPYIYREPVEKVMFTFREDYITYYENRSHEFVSAQSGNLSENDIVSVPNIAFISAIPNIKKIGLLGEIGFRTILSLTKPKEFHLLDIKKYFHGYSDDFMSMISKVKWDFTPESVGILAPRRGLSKKSLTINSGAKNAYDVGKIYEIDGKKIQDIWKSDVCNKISGCDGVLYGPMEVRNKQIVRVFLPEFCRSLPLAYEKVVEAVNGIPVFQYNAPVGTFSENSEYYCELKSVNENHTNGVLEVSDCIDGNPPIFISHPHFMEGDEKLLKHFEGLSPNQSLHSSYAYLHPRLSVPVFGVSRMQINLRVTHYKNHFKNLPDGLILPLAWVETTNEEFPEEFRLKLILSTIVVDYIEVFFKYVSILSFTMSTIYLFIGIIYCR